MTRADIKKVYNDYLKDAIPSIFNLNKDILYNTSIDDLLVGFCFERSGFNKDCIYVSVFVQPLYIKSDCIVLTFGHRLRSKRNGELWHLKNNPKIDKTIVELKSLMQKEIMEFLSKVTNANDFYQHFKKKKVKNIRIKEALVYSAIYAEDIKSRELLQDFLEEVKKEDLDIGWINDVLQNAMKLKELLDQNDSVNLLLNKNIEVTRSHLKII